MRNIADNRLFNIILLFTIIGEFLVPWILEQFYAAYSGKTMVMSALGSPQSPVRFVYNLWLIWLGGFLTYTAGAYFLSLRARFPVLAVFTPIKNRLISFAIIGIFIVFSAKKCVMRTESMAIADDHFIVRQSVVNTNR